MNDHLEQDADGQPYASPRLPAMLWFGNLTNEERVTVIRAIKLRWCLTCGKRKHFSLCQCENDE